MWYMYVYIHTHTHTHTHTYIHIYIYIMEYYSTMKKNEICHLQQHGGHYAKWNKTEKDKHCITSLICGTWKLQQTSEYNKKETDSQI